MADIDVMTTELEALLSLFEKITAIEGKSLQERSIANVIHSIAKELDCIVFEDDTSSKTGSTAGNLFLFPKEWDKNKPSLVLTAHLDTARSTGKVNVQRHSDRVTSDGTTQLGVDNRAGVSILLYLLQRRRELLPDSLNFFVLLTVAEEVGLLGAEAVDLDRYNIEEIFVFDSSMRPGKYIQECAGMYLFEAKVIGKATHSAIHPEEGISAIEVMSKIISSLKFGRLDDHITTNIGLISGGEASNIVAPSCRVEGEVRAMDLDSIQKVLALYEEAFHKEAEELGAKVSFISRKDFLPYTHGFDAPIIKRLQNAFTRIGVAYEGVQYTGGSDANAYNAKGIPAINIGIGASNPHSNEEYMLYDDFLTTLRFAQALLTPTTSA